MKKEYLYEELTAQQAAELYEQGYDVICHAGKCILQKSA